MKPLKRKIRLAKAVLFWEALWPAMWPLLGLGGLFFLLAFAGLFEILPRDFHIAVLAGFFLCAGWAARNLFNLRIPDDQSALRHLEKTSNLAHRPASSYTDNLGTNPNDSQSMALWRAHKHRLAALIAKLKLSWPHPKLMRRDPYALRSALILGLIAAFFLGKAEWQTRLTNAVSPVDKTSKTIWVEAWVSPPTYTGKAPLFLAGKGHTITPDDNGLIEVPEGSKLTVRVSHAAKPKLIAAQPGTTPDKPDEQSIKFGQLSDATREAKHTLMKSQDIRIESSGANVTKWRFKILPDATPQIVITEPIGKSVNHALQFEFKITDDYGVTQAATHFELVPDKNKKNQPVAPLNVKIPDFALTLPNARTTSFKHKSFRDLTAHPWAGLAVRMHITARDEALQTGRSNKVTFKLPARPFSKPLAKAIIEQRSKLVYDTNDRFKITVALDAISLASQDLAKDTGVYLALRTTFYKLSRARGMQTFREIVDVLWDIALSVEDGDLSLAERELRRAQEALAKALSSNATDKEIKQLMSKLRQALNKYLQALAEQARRNPNQQRAQNNNQRSVSQLDLNKLLNKLENLARTGARDAAQQLLAQLRNLLENLQAGRQQGGQQGRQGQSGLSKMLNGLSGLIAKQQQLMDKTFQGRGQGKGKGQQGQPGNGKGQGLANDQDALAKALDAIRRRLGRSGLKPPSALGRAGEAMRGAAGNLRGNERRQALSNQGRAIDQLRQGAQALAKEMMKRMTRGQNRGRGRGQVRGQNRDPLGRPVRTTGPDFGDTTKVPSEIEIQRARRIMRELQQRLGDRARPLLELDYIERLLRRF